LFILEKFNDRIEFFGKSGIKIEEENWGTKLTSSGII